MKILILLLVWCVDLFFTVFTAPVQLGSETLPEKQIASPHANQAIWRTIDSDQPLAQPALTVASQSSITEQTEKFIGLVRLSTPAWGYDKQANCNYVIQREEPVEIWLLSYFPEREGCIEKGQFVQVVIWSCAYCKDDLIKVLPLIEL